MRSQSLLRLLLLPAIEVVMFGVGVLISSRLQNRTAKADGAPKPPWVRPDGSVDLSAMGCVTFAGPDGKAVKGRDGKPICVPYDSWAKPDEPKQLTASEVEQLPEEQKAKVRHLSDGTFWIREEPQVVDYRWVLEREGLPDPWAGQEHPAPVKISP